MNRTFFLVQKRETATVRNQAFQEVAARRQAIENQAAQHDASISTDDLLNVVKKLQSGSLIYSGEDSTGNTKLFYIASRKAKEEIFSAVPGGAWDEKILKKHRNAFRSSYGALFRFPLEEQDEVLEAFITDWSPFPVAAALAVHKNHPFARVAAKKNGSYFTGRFARHPLTGDLLPVWVASWVKPEFGTGVVIVNPAHSQADLDFAREIGLTIRFGLTTAPISSDPETWPAPPIVKAGKSIKTGDFDGLEFEEAAAKYLERLSAHGFAESYVNRSIAACPVATLKQDASGGLYFCAHCEKVEKTGDSGSEICGECNAEKILVSLEPDGILETVMKIDENSGDIDLFSPAADVESALLFGRLLYFDIWQRPLEPQNLYVLGGEEKPASNSDLPPEIAQLCALAAAPLNQVAVFKKQLIEQVQLFFTRHNQLCEAYQEGNLQPSHWDHALGKTFARTKEQLVNWNLKEAFLSLYEAQKQLSKEPGETLNLLLPAYFMLTFVLAGYRYPNLPEITDVWNSL